MKRISFSAIAAVALGASSLVNAATVRPIVVPKKQVKVVRSECLVVATEAKRIAPVITAPEAFGREFYSKISENVNAITFLGVSVNVLDLLGVPDGRDVLGTRVQAPSGPGWRSLYLDTGTPGATQRHHYGFYFFATANDGGLDYILASLGNYANDVKDVLTDNEGDLWLAEEALRQGEMARTSGVGVISGQVKAVLCNQ